MDTTLEDLKKQLQRSNNAIEDLHNRNGFILLSKEKYTRQEQSDLFDKYKDEECVKCIYDNLLNISHSRYFYVEEINDNKIFKERNGILTYVMLNPSYARSEKSDKTMDRARNYARQISHENIGFKYFAVINLYAYRHHKPKELNKILKGKIEIPFNKNYNFEFIKSYVDTHFSDTFVLAYGRSGYEKDKQELLKILEHNKKYTFFKSKYPYHLLCTKEVYDKNHKLHLYLLNPNSLL